MNKNSLHLSIHIGQTKAGSTAIQNYLENQRAALLERGILFPKTGLSRSNPFDAKRTPGHLHLFRNIAQDQTADFETEISEENFSRLVLSAENLFFDRSDQELSAIGNYFADFRCELVVVLRSLPDWLLSRYKEDCVSGFKLQQNNFAEFCADKAAHGLHDYATRLSHVAGLLRARDVRVINYDAATQADGIVPAFLRAADLPETNPALARSIRANIREKDMDLTESKRRINHVLAGLPVPARLELEARLRAYARTLPHPAPSPAPHADAHAVPLSESDCHTAAMSNRRLVEAYGLSPPLKDPRPAAAEKWPHRQSSDRLDALVRFGLKDAASLFQRAAQDPSGSRHMLAPFMAIPGTELVTDALAQAQVSLHVGMPATAVMASCFARKLTFLAMEDAGKFSVIDSLQALRLPSEIIEAGHGTYATPVFQNVVAAENSRLSLIIAPATLDMQVMKFWLGFAQERCQIFVLGHGPLIEDLQSEATALNLRDAHGTAHLYELSENYQGRALT